MVDPQLNTRVDEEVRESVEEYAEREQTNKSSVVRQFILAGMDQYEELPDGVELPQTVQTQRAPESRSSPTLVETLASPAAPASAIVLLLLASAVMLLTAVLVPPESTVLVLAGVVTFGGMLTAAAVIVCLAAAAVLTLRSAEDAEDATAAEGGADT